MCSLVYQTPSRSRDQMSVEHYEMSPAGGGHLGSQPLSRQRPHRGEVTPAQRTQAGVGVARVADTLPATTEKFEYNSRGLLNTSLSFFIHLFSITEKVGVFTCPPLHQFQFFIYLPEQIWDLETKLGLFGDHFSSSVPFGTKS